MKNYTVSFNESPLLTNTKAQSKENAEKRAKQFADQFKLTIKSITEEAD